MVEYICDMCQKVFYHKSTYQRHLKRVKSCNLHQFAPKTGKNAPICTENNHNESITSCANNIIIPEIKPFTCEFCSKKFTRNYTLRRHKKDRCKEYLYRLGQTEILEAIDSMKAEINSLRSEKTSTINNVVNNIVNQNIQQTNNVMINMFGKEDMSHITDDDYKMIFNKFRSCIPLFIQMKHYNTKKVENGNVFISNIKSDIVMIYKGTKWIIADQDETIQNMYDYNCEYLIDKFENMKNDLDERTQIKFNRFINSYEDKKMIDDSKKEIRFILYNNRDIVNRK